LITDMAGLVEALRRRKEELNLSNATIDAIAGMQDGYASKLLAPKPVRHIGYRSLGDLMGALGVGLVLVEDSAGRARLESLWEPRKRSPTIRPGHGALLETQSAVEVSEIVERIENDGD
jgi:hypothetical protein